MVKTVTLTADTPQKVTFEGAYPYYWIDNKSAGNIYASVGRTPEADTDDTYTVAAGSQLRISGGVGNDGLTLLGEGKVQVIASAIAACPFKSASEGGGIKSINGLAAADGVLELTQSLIPSDGAAYQMPYYIQTGTISVGSEAHKGVEITFPTAFANEPILILGGTVDTTTSVYSVIANYKELTKDGFTMFARRIGNSGIMTLNDNSPAVVRWTAFGHLNFIDKVEAKEDAKSDKN